MEQMKTTIEPEVTRASYILVTGTLRANEFEGSTISKQGIAYAGAVWPARKTLILLPPSNSEDGQHWIAGGYLGEMVAEIKGIITARRWWVRLIPLRWEIYIAQSRTIASVDLKKNHFEVLPPEHRFRTEEIEQTVALELPRQPL